MRVLAFHVSIEHVFGRPLLSITAEVTPFSSDLLQIIARYAGYCLATPQADYFRFFDLKIPTSAAHRANPIRGLTPALAVAPDGCLWAAFDTTVVKFAENPEPYNDDIGQLQFELKQSASAMAFDGDELFVGTVSFFVSL